MRYIGVDVGKKRCQACIMDEGGRVMDEFPFENTLEGMRGLLQGLPDCDCRAVVELTDQQTQLFYPLLQTLFSMKIDKINLGLAAEFAVASELCRRNIYAQLTLGPRKRTDLLIDKPEEMVRIQVKAKQGNVWPNCKGVFGDQILVFVDYYKKEPNERPDFYILTADDWVNVIETRFGEQIKSGELVLDEHNVPVWMNQIKQGQPYKGHSTSVKDVVKYKDQWEKI